MKSTTRHLLLGLFFISMYGISQAQVSQAGGPIKVDSLIQPEHIAGTFVTSSPRDQVSAPMPKAFILPALSRQQNSAVGTDAKKPGAPQQVSSGRDVKALAAVDDTVANLDWHDVPGGGKRAAISISLSEAKGVRLGVRVFELPPEALVRVYAQASNSAIEITGKEILSTIRLNLDAGLSGDLANIYWMPLVEGPQATIDFELPEGVDTKGLRVAIPKASHFYELPSAASGSYATGDVGSSAACEINVACHPEWMDISNATARMSYVDRYGDGYLCSGTLLNNTADKYTPYFLTANHCISDQVTASSLQTDWFFRSSQCSNSNLDSTGYKSVIGGASLLYTSDYTDTTLLQLRRPPPSGAIYSAWSTENPYVPGGLATSIHHPKGDLQKYTTGYISYISHCVIYKFNGDMECYDSPGTAGSHVQLSFTSGISEPGSSGSGLFVSGASGHYLVGQLSGGSSSCGSNNSYGYYGRFDMAYSDGMKRWLSPDVCPEVAVYRYRNTKILGHFYTTSKSEAETLISNGAPLLYEGVAFTACKSGNTSAGIYPVYRFKHLSNDGIYFYSMLPSEIKNVQDNLSNILQDQGIAFYAFNEIASGKYPMYRFRNVKIPGANFYTILSSERGNINKNVPDYAEEGVGFYAYPPR